MLIVNPYNDACEICQTVLINDEQPQLIEVNCCFSVFHLACLKKHEDYCDDRNYPFFCRNCHASTKRRLRVKNHKHVHPDQWEYRNVDPSEWTETYKVPADPDTEKPVCVLCLNKSNENKQQQFVKIGCCSSIYHLRCLKAFEHNFQSRNEPITCPDCGTQVDRIEQPILLAFEHGASGCSQDI